MGWQFRIDRGDTSTDIVARGDGRIAILMPLRKQYYTGTDIVQGCVLAKPGGDAFIIDPPGGFGPS